MVVNHPFQTNNQPRKRINNEIQCGNSCLADRVSQVLVNLCYVECYPENNEINGQCRCKKHIPRQRGKENILEGTRIRPLKAGLTWKPPRSTALAWPHMAAASSHNVPLT